MKIITKKDNEYPKRLLEIQKPPEKLYVEGDVTLLNKELAIAIVGTRKCTEYGKKYCKQFAKELAQKNVCIVSGMAEGIDSIAHINSMCEIGKTIAVLGSGFKHIFPEKNKYLYNKILENEGCIITEYLPETEVNMANFPRRNRIISGLAMGALVIEASYRSGSTITARYALSQNKEVFCIPNRLDEKMGYGTNWLIKNGANLVMEPEDILECYIEEGDDNKIEVPEEDAEIYNLIGEYPISANELSKTTGKSISQVKQTLSMLELDGLIKGMAGNKYISVSN